MPWASPEQALGSSAGVDARGDVYALGVMLYVALTGQFPYQVFGPVREVLDNIIKVRPVPPSRVVEGGPSRRATAPALDAVVMKALAKDPQDRYPTAAELAADLQRHLEGHAVTAYRPRRRLLTRRRVAAALAAATALAAAAALSGLL
jgi:serine/threonine-protein kinase